MKRNTFAYAIIVVLFVALFGAFKFLPQRNSLAETFVPFQAKTFAPFVDQATLAVQTVIRRALPNLPSPRVAALPAVVQALTRSISPAQNAAVAPSLEQRVVAAVVERVAEAAAPQVLETNVLKSAVTAVEDVTPESVTPTKSRLLKGINIQAGVVAVSGHATGYVAALQWLKYGTTNDPRHLRYAFASPAYFFAPNIHELGLLPISVNVASLVPHQPLTNVWVSPYVSVNLAALGSQRVDLKRIGISLTATF